MNNNIPPYNQSFILPYGQPTTSAVPAFVDAQYVHDNAGIYRVKGMSDTFVYESNGKGMVVYYDTNRPSEGNDVWAGVKAHAGVNFFIHTPSLKVEKSKESPLKMYWVWYKIGGTKYWVAGNKLDTNGIVAMTFTYDEAVQLAKILRGRNEDAGYQEVGL